MVIHILGFYILSLQHILRGYSLILCPICIDDSKIGRVPKLQLDKKAF